MKDYCKFKKNRGILINNFYFNVINLLNPSSIITG